MARVKKTDNIEETNVNESETVVEKETNKKTLEEVMAEKEAKLIKEAEPQLSELEQRKLARQKQRNVLKSIKDDLGILMYCNAGNTEVIYECPNSHMLYKMTYGDTEWMTYKEIKTMKSQHEGMLKNYIIVPVDVDSDEFELEDILKVLGLDKLYEDASYLFEDNIDYILNNLKFETFKLLVNESLATESKEAYLKRIVDRAIELVVKGQFNDYQKMSYMEDVMGDKEHEMFKSAIESYKEFGI